MNRKYMKRKVDEPTMSDATLLLQVEDLISMAMGPPKKNVVNFKILQTVLLILARHMRMLDQKVELQLEYLEDLEDHVKNEEYEEGKGGTDDTRKILEYKKGESFRLSGRNSDDSDDKNEKQSSKSKDSSKTRGKRGDKEGKGKKSHDEEVSGKVKGGKEVDETEKEGIKVGKDSPVEGKKAKGAKGSKGKEDGKTEAGMKSEIRKGSDISVEETIRGGEKVLVVGQGKGEKKGFHGSATSIDVVTMTMFRELEKVVRELKGKAGPMPHPTMPDNAKLRADLAKGSASLQDMMKAMQVTARMDAAEKAVETLSELLTSLAADGYLPPDIANKVADMKQNVDDMLKESRAAYDEGRVDKAGEAEGTGKDSSGGGSKTKKSIPVIDENGRLGAFGKNASAVSRKSAGGKSVAGQSLGALAHGFGSVGGPSMTSGTNTISPVVVSTKSGDTGRFATPQEVDIEIENVKQALLQEMRNSAGRGLAMAETAFQTARTLRESMNVALSINKRIDAVTTIIEDYSNQLSGFDTGVKTQISSFQEQINQMTREINAAMKVIENANNNAETAAVMELSERHAALGYEFEQMTQNHGFLTNKQARLTADLKALMEAVEGFGEQKADREEVIDGLKDKADSSRLAGLLSEDIFSHIREDLEQRINLCYDKFRNQDKIWTDALQQIGDVVSGKAQHAQLLAFRDETEDRLRLTHKRLQLLARILGEPKAAILNREVSRDGRCASCGQCAMMGRHPEAGGAPPRLPGLGAGSGPAQNSEDDLCLRELVDAADDEPPEGRRQAHACHRWTGGSHTLMNDRVSWKRAPQPVGTPLAVKKVVGMGSDGKNYRLEEQLLPCVECNQLSSDIEERSDKKGDNVTKTVTITTPHEGVQVSDHVHGHLPKTSIAPGSVMATTLLVKDQIILPKVLIVEVDGTPAREHEIGHIVEGVALVVDELIARRASVKYEAAQTKKHEAEIAAVIPQGPGT